jgi:hypothetical protein
MCRHHIMYGLCKRCWDVEDAKAVLPAKPAVDVTAADSVCAKYDQWLEGFVNHRIKEIDTSMMSMYPDEMLLTVRKMMLCYPCPHWTMSGAVHLPMQVHLAILDYLCSLEAACLVDHGTEKPKNPSAHQHCGVAPSEEYAVTLGSRGPDRVYTVPLDSRGPDRVCADSLGSRGPDRVYAATLGSRGPDRAYSTPLSGRVPDKVYDEIEQ